MPLPRVTRNGPRADIFIRGAIGGDGVIAAEVAAALAAANGVDSLHVHIDSRGGEVSESRKIAGQLRQFRARTTARIDGVCASAATSIALACNEVEMADGAFFMIHNARDLFGECWRDKGPDAPATLATITAGLVRDYAAKTGRSCAQIRAWMDEEKWFTAAEAKRYGFVDRIVSGSGFDTASNQRRLIEALGIKADGPRERPIGPSVINRGVDSLAWRMGPHGAAAAAWMAHRLY